MTIGPVLEWLGGKIDVRVEVALDPGDDVALWDVSEWDVSLWAGAAPDWVDVTEYASDITIDRGRRRWGERYRPGRLDHLLQNTDGRFTPDAGANPYGLKFRPGRLARVVVAPDPDFPSVVYELFSGRVDDAVDRIIDGGSDIVAAVRTVDALADLANINPPATSATGVQRSDERVAAALDYAGWPAPDRLIQRGVYDVQSSDLAQTTLEESARAADAEGGELFADERNRVVFRHRDWLVGGGLAAMELYAAATLAKNPVAYWRMSDTAEDDETTSHDLTWSGSPTTGQTGVDPNLIRNPSFETGALAPHAVFDSAGGSADWSVVADAGARHGDHVLRHDASGLTGNTRLQFNGLETAGSVPHAAVVEGLDVIGFFWAKSGSPAAANRVRMRAEFFDSAGVHLGGTGGSWLTPSTGDWEFELVEDTAPADAAYVVFDVEVENTGNPEDIIDFDTILCHVAAEPDEAVGLDGSDDYATAASSDGVSLDLQAAPRTVEAWLLVDPAASGTNVAVASKAGTDADLFIGYEASTGRIVGTATSWPVATGEWVHVVITEQPLVSTWQQRLYVNGILVDESTTRTIFTGAAEFHVGRFDSAGGLYFQGRISELPIYDRVLSAAEVLDQYDAHTAGVDFENPRATTVQGYIGYETEQEPGVPYGRWVDVQTSYERARVENDIRLAATGGTEQRVENVASQDQYGHRTYPRHDLINNSDTDVLFLAERRLAANKDLRRRVESVTLVANDDPDNDDLNRLFWALQFGDLVEVAVSTLHGWSQTFQAHVTGIRHHITGSDWMVTYSLDDSLVEVFQALEEEES